MDVLCTHILDTIPDCIRVIDKHKKIVWVNRGFEQLVEKDRGMLCQDSCHHYYCPQSTLGEDYCYFDRIATGDAVPPREIALKDRDGNGKVFIATYSPYKDKDGEIIGVVEYLREITSLARARTALEEQLLRSKVILGKTVNSLVSAIESRDPYTAGHQRKVSQLVRKVAQFLKPEERKWIEGIRVAAQLHDIGKICVPAEILSHPGRLGREQFELIKLHSETGNLILRNIDFTFGFSLGDTILQHHERLDGTGYPKNLSYGEIILEARILAVADVIEAMINHRPYRAGLGLDCAMKEVKENAGKKYDKEVVEVCRHLFLKEKFEFKEPPSAHH
jgi:PAS domain S-box-containing protein